MSLKQWRLVLRYPAPFDAQDYFKNFGAQSEFVVNTNGVLHIGAWDSMDAQLHNKIYISLY